MAGGEGDSFERLVLVENTLVSLSKSSYVVRRHAVLLSNKHNDLLHRQLCVTKMLTESCLVATVIAACATVQLVLLLLLSCSDDKRDSPVALYLLH